MSSSAWCDLKTKGVRRYFHDLCHNPKRNYQKQLTFSPKQFQLEGAGFKKTMEKN